jgi:hypothetical protein
MTMDIYCLFFIDRHKSTVRETIVWAGGGAPCNPHQAYRLDLQHGVRFSLLLLPWLFRSLSLDFARSTSLPSLAEEEERETDPMLHAMSTPIAVSLLILFLPLINLASVF